MSESRIAGTEPYQMQNNAGSRAVDLAVAEPLSRVEALDYTRGVGHAAIPALEMRPTERQRGSQPRATGLTAWESTELPDPPPGGYMRATIRKKPLTRTPTLAEVRTGREARRRHRPRRSAAAGEEGHE